jgi:hypothetical protein
MARERSLTEQDLANELDRLRKEVGNSKEWMVPIRRTRGQGKRESPIMDRKISWETKKEPTKLATMGRLFQTVGIQIPKKLEEVLPETLTTSRDGESCFRALRDLPDLRAFSKERWKEWNKLVRERFKEEPMMEETQGKKSGGMREMITLMKQALRGGEEWRQEMEGRAAGIDRKM